MHANTDIKRLIIDIIACLVYKRLKCTNLYLDQLELAKSSLRV